MSADVVGPVLDELSRSECLALLGGCCVGRVAVARSAGSPIVVPVNYVLDGDAIVFRSDPGDKLTALRHRPITFEVDEIDPFHHTGWSVVVQGLGLVSDGQPSGTTDFEPWAPGDKRFWVRISPASISGRRITFAAGPPDLRAYL